MATRGLITFKNNKNFKIHFYNHYDSYFSGLGYSFVRFLNSVNLVELEKVLVNAKFTEDYDTFQECINIEKSTLILVFLII